MGVRGEDRKLPDDYKEFGNVQGPNGNETATAKMSTGWRLEMEDGRDMDDQGARPETELCTREMERDTRESDMNETATNGVPELQEREEERESSDYEKENSNGNRDKESR